MSDDLKEQLTRHDIGTLPSAGLAMLGEKAAARIKELESQLDRAVEALEKTTDASENMNIAIGMGWDLEGVQEIAAEYNHAARDLIKELKGRADDAEE